MKKMVTENTNTKTAPASRLSEQDASVAVHCICVVRRYRNGLHAVWF